jgi:iron complex outermembrane recepter protein
MSVKSIRLMSATPVLLLLIVFWMIQPARAGSLRQAQQPTLDPSSPTTVETVQITGVTLTPLERGLDIQLESTAGLPLTAQTQADGNTLIAEVANAVLALPSGQEFRSNNPTPEITSVSVTQLEGNRIQIRVAGKETLPSATVQSNSQGLMLAVSLANEEEELVVTGDDDTSYRAPNATTATKTDTPTRDIPQSIQVIPQQVIDDQKVLRLQDAVRNVSGVVSDGGFGNVGEEFIIRGFTAPSILRDGFRSTSEISASTFSSLSETANIERVEVLKGPASVLYGAVEPGGIINIVTKKPLADPLYAGEFSVGSYGSYRPSFDFSGPLTANKAFLYRVTGSYENSDSFRQPSDVNFERFFIAPVISWRMSPKTNLDVFLNYLTEESPFDEGLVAIGDEVADIPLDRRLGEPGDFRKFKDLQLGYRFEHEFNPNLKVRNAFRAALTDVSSERFVPFVLFENAGILRREYRETEGNRQSYDIQTDLIGTLKTGPVKHQLLLGFQYFNTSEAEVIERNRLVDPINIFDPVYGAIRPETLRLVDDSISNEESLGFYLQDQVSLLENLKLLIGGRFDFVHQESIDNINDSTDSQDDNAFSPRVGLVYQPIQPISLYTSFSRSFRPNTGSVTADNSILEPERGTQYEVGIKAEPGTNKLTLSLAYYDITKKNVALTDPNDPDFSIAAGKVNSHGVEFDLAGEIRPGWKVIASYAYTIATIQDGDEFLPTGNDLENVPRNSASLWTSYEIQAGSLKGLGFGLGLFYVDQRPGDNENTFKLPSYLRTDAALFYQRENWKLGLNIKNLFDVRYFDSAVVRERINPGEPLTVVGSVSVKF